MKTFKLLTAALCLLAMATNGLAQKDYWQQFFFGIRSMYNDLQEQNRCQ